MLYAWQGAIRSLKKQMTALGLHVTQHASWRWQSQSFSGLMVHLHLDPERPASEDTLSAVVEMELPLNGFIVADVTIEVLDKPPAPPRWKLEFLLMDAELNTWDT